MGGKWDMMDGNCVLKENEPSLQKLLPFGGQQ